jgi:chromosome segregation protein
MLKIEKLQITGFKSFADHTEVMLGDGITAVVGPNGCGKSNIADAVTWVLGEQSAKNLRGAKMEDVIFNGTRDRKPMGMAEVLLTLVAVEDLTFKSEVDDIELPDEPDVEIPEAAIDDAAPAADVSAVADGPAPEAPKAPKKAHRPRRVRETMVGNLMAGERVTVGRRLYRSGESEYVMNGRGCRLRDIQDLFAGTGLGAAHYAIIEQGRIGQILSSKPQDRRALIEEAAGITKFKSRKRAAELRLESARQNLSRLNDIVFEVERQIGSLKRQAAKARRYRRLREEMRGLLREIFASDWESTGAALERVALGSEQAHVEQNEISRALGEGEAGYRTALARAREAEEELAVVRDRVAHLELEADRARNRHLHQREQLAELMLRREELDRDRGATGERLDVITSERTRKAAELATLGSETDAESVRLAEQEAAYQTTLRSLREREQSLEALRSKLVAEVGHTERLRNMRLQHDEAERRLGLEAARLDREAEAAAARRSEAESEMSRLGEEMELSKARLDALQQEIVERVEALSVAKAKAREAATRLSTLQDRRSARAHRLASLEELDARHAYYSDAVQQVLSLDGNAFNALGTLADYAEPDTRYEQALESLFGRELQSILVPGLDDALSGVEFLVGTSAGRASFLVVGLGGGEAGGYIAEEEEIGDVSGGANATGGPVNALALLRLPKEIARAVEKAYPEKATALVVESLTAALELSRAREAAGEGGLFVTLNGDQVRNGRVLVGGTAAAQGANLLGIKREIKDLKGELERVVYEVSECEAELSEANHGVSRLESESGELDTALRDDEKTAVAHDLGFKQHRAEYERAEQHIRVVDSERTRLAEERAELAARRSALATEVEEAVAQKERVETALGSAQSQVVELREGMEAEGERLAEARALAAGRQERRRALAAEVRRLADEEAHLGARRDRGGVESVEIEGRIEQLSASLAETEGRSEDFSSQRVGMGDALSVATSALAAARERADVLEAELTALRAKLDAARDRSTELDVERARLHSDLEHVRRACVAELGQEVEEVVEAARAARAARADGIVDVDESDEADEGGGEPFVADAPLEPVPLDPVEAARARMAAIRRTLDSIGAVNMMALEELEESESRFSFLTTQRQDILDSIEATEQALSEIKRRSRQRFREAFVEINRNFSDMFQELFGGGRGEMVLLDEEDLLESGVDIIAQPPGKRLQNVQLLSGGEKALTAIALVLGIFKYKPSPFCILDEVDAPLDEVNVGRFSDHILDMSRTTQFLVITHSKRTMEGARALYGVTMEEPGVSKLVSVRFAD